VAHKVAEKALKVMAFHRDNRFVISHSLTELMISLEVAGLEISR